MNGLFREVENVIAAATGDASSVVSSSGVSGGCINHAQKIELQDGRKFFLKSNVSAGGMFACEAAGLRALARSGAVSVPAAIGIGKADQESFLVLEYVERATPSADFMSRLGQQLAELHNAQCQGNEFGFEDDNFIGATPQPNHWSGNWVEFWAEQRLRFQLKRAQDSGLSSSELNKRGDVLVERLSNFLPEHPRLSLIHGDLWSGNYICDSSGQPVLIDPAVYYADAEAEFGMISLFGGVSAEFFHAYHQARPRREGEDIRIAIYRLYHLLNHLNLFGSSYLSGCIDILKRLT